jgi:hypothetical protein
MTLPSKLLQAASAQGGGRIALVLGAGCSVEHPTCIPVASQCSLVIHAQLLADNVLHEGDCKSPDDLSLVADAVFEKTQKQRDVVERLADTYGLKLASSNYGYKCAAALLAEGVIASIVTLNFDLALTHALAELGVTNVGVVESPSDMGKQKAVNVYYLHRNANATDPEAWILRSGSIHEGWKNDWEPVIAQSVLSAPHVVFVGLGSPITVLTETVKLIRNALPGSTSMYQVDVAEFAKSTLAPTLGIAEASYVRSEWGQFMRELSNRVARAQVEQMAQAVVTQTHDQNLAVEATEPLTSRFLSIGLLGIGILRACWLLHTKPYFAAQPDSEKLVADLVIALAMVARVTGTAALIADDGIVEFQRDGRTVGAFFVASGKGHRSLMAIEAELTKRRMRYSTRQYAPRGGIVAGTSDAWAAKPSPPTDILGGVPSGDLVRGPDSEFAVWHVGELRQQPALLSGLVP